MTFLKNVLVRYFKEGDLDNALPVIAQALDFSPQEVSEIRQVRQTGLRGAAAINDYSPCRVCKLTANANVTRTRTREELFSAGRFGRRNQGRRSSSARSLPPTAASLPP